MTSLAKDLTQAAMTGAAISFTSNDQTPQDDHCRP
jgi:hypothetical protein